MCVCVCVGLIKQPLPFQQLFFFFPFENDFLKTRKSLLKQLQRHFPQDTMSPGSTQSGSLLINRRFHNRLINIL